MDKLLQQKLFSKYRNLYILCNKENQLLASISRFGIECGPGWYHLINELSLQLETLIVKSIQGNPSPRCSFCECDKEKHFSHLTHEPKHCLAIKEDPESAELPPNNYLKCACEQYIPRQAYAVQVKSKFNQLRFYMDNESKEMRDLIFEAEAKSIYICEGCGRDKREISSCQEHTLCNRCKESKNV